MTLVLSLLNINGITMAADSAKTWSTKDGRKSVELGSFEKLQVIPHLAASVACWGSGEIKDMPTDEWLRQFINMSNSLADLDSFANTLADQLNHDIPEKQLLPDKHQIGFQLAGYVPYKGAMAPTFYHVHNGKSGVLESRGQSVDPYKVNANHDWPPDLLEEQIDKHGPVWNWNGTFLLHAHIFYALQWAFKELKTRHNIIIPHSQGLRDDASFLTFQLKITAQLQRFSNITPGIGGRIDYLGINGSGVQFFGSDMV